jgi:putative two-component system response regulator
MAKVVVIEDDKSMLDLLTALLELEGFQVKTFRRTTCLEDLYNHVLEEQPDLVLLDVHLGGLNGFDLLSLIKSNGSTGGLKVLMSSGMEIEKEARLRGADGFILKPYMPDELIFQIKQILGN